MTTSEMVITGGAVDGTATACDVCYGAGTCIDGACLPCATTGDLEAGAEINAAMMRDLLPEHLTRLVARHAALVTWQGITISHALVARGEVLWSVWFSKRPPAEVVNAFNRHPRPAHAAGSKGVVCEWGVPDMDEWVYYAMQIAKARGY